MNRGFTASSSANLAPTPSVPPKARPDLVASILARLATEHHMVYCAAGAEMLVAPVPRHFARARRRAGFRTHRQSDARPPAGTPRRPPIAARTGCRAARPVQEHVRPGYRAAPLVRPDPECRIHGFRADGGNDSGLRARAGTEGARLPVGGGRSADPVSDPPAPGAPRHRAAGRGAPAGQELRAPQRAASSPICWTSTASPGNTSRAIFRYSGMRRDAFPSRSRPISICRSSICTWNSPP